MNTVTKETNNFIKSLDLIIENCKNYHFLNNSQFEKVKEYMLINNSELFNGEDSEFNIIYDFCKIKTNERNQAENLKFLILKNI